MPTLAVALPHARCPPDTRLSPGVLSYNASYDVEYSRHPPTTPTPAAHQPPPSAASALQFPASDRECSTDRYVVHPSGALAALLWRAEGAELPEDKLSGTLREWGLLITRLSSSTCPALRDGSRVAFLQLQGRGLHSLTEELNLRTFEIHRSRYE